MNTSQGTPNKSKKGIVHVLSSNEEVEESSSWKEVERTCLAWIEEYNTIPSAAKRDPGLVKLLLILLWYMVIAMNQANHCQSNNSCEKE